MGSSNSKAKNDNNITNGIAINSDDLRKFWTDNWFDILKIIGIDENKSNTSNATTKTTTTTDTKSRSCAGNTKQESKQTLEIPEIKDVQTYSTVLKWILSQKTLCSSPVQLMLLMEQMIDSLRALYSGIVLGNNNLQLQSHQESDSILAKSSAIFAEPSLTLPRGISQIVEDYIWCKDWTKCLFAAECAKGLDNYEDSTIRRLVWNNYGLRLVVYTRKGEICMELITPDNFDTIVDQSREAMDLSVSGDKIIKVDVEFVGCLHKTYYFTGSGKKQASKFECILKNYNRLQEADVPFINIEEYDCDLFQCKHYNSETYENDHCFLDLGYKVNYSVMANFAPTEVRACAHRKRSRDVFALAIAAYESLGKKSK